LGIKRRIRLRRTADTSWSAASFGECPIRIFHLQKKSTLVSELMKARSTVRSAKLAVDQVREAAAHRALDVVKRELGERGPVWWSDGTPDPNRQAVKNTPYAKWYSGLRASRRRGET
jgi:hypothetical protein